VFEARVRLLAVAAILLASASFLEANVVRPAPNFAWTDSTGKNQQLSKFKGQPVVILISPSPLSWRFRSQVGQLQGVYERLATAQAIVVAAFTSEGGRIRSNIPFVNAADGPGVAALYYPNLPVGRSAVAIVGRDGNLDFIGERVLSGQRVLDIINNSFVNQAALRRD